MLLLKNRIKSIIMDKKKVKPAICPGCMYHGKNWVNPITGICNAPYLWAWKYFPACFIQESCPEGSQ